MANGKFTKGWLAMYRSLRAPRTDGGDINPFYGDGYMLAIWFNLLSDALIVDGKKIPKGFTRKLRRGECLTSISTLSKDTSFTRVTVRRVLDDLEKNESVSIERSEAKKDYGMIVKILNFNKYQREYGTSDTNYHTDTHTDYHTDTHTDYHTDTHTGTHIRQGNKETKKQRNNGTKKSIDSPAMLGVSDNPSTDSKPKKKTTTSLTKMNAKAPSAKIYQAYAVAYSSKYGYEPVSNAKGYSLCRELLKRLGEELATSVAIFYLSHPDSFYVHSCHSLELLVKNAEKLALEYKKQKFMLKGEARTVELGSHNRTVIENVMKQKGIER